MGVVMIQLELTKDEAKYIADALELGDDPEAERTEACDVAEAIRAALDAAYPDETVNCVWISHAALETQVEASEHQRCVEEYDDPRLRMTE